MRWSISRFRSNPYSCMWQLIWAFAGAAAFGSGGQKSEIRGRRSELHTDDSPTLRFLRDQALSGDRNRESSFESTLPLPCRNRAKRNGNNSQPRGCVAIDSGPDRRGEFLTLPAG